MAGIRFDNVTKRFGDVVAVGAMTFEIDDGDFVVLLGPSGCGKSTVLRLMAGLESPDEGTITIGDEVVNDVEAKHRDVAMVFQSYALYPHMSVAKNIGFSLKPQGLTRADRERRVREAAELLGLTELLGRKPGQLSGGQRQRVALARAIVREPRAFLMDEPLSNLDAKLRSETRVELVNLHHRLGTTVVFVTHDQTEAMTMADRIAVMVEGRLQQVGSPQEIYDTPANLFVARFIGNPAMNTWETSIDDAGQPVLGDGTAVMCCQKNSNIASGAQVVVGVRPDDLGFDVVGVPAVTELVESMGHERLVSCRLATGDRAVVRIGGRDACPAVGEAVHLSVDPGTVSLFDAGSGERLS